MAAIVFGCARMYLYISVQYQPYLVAVSGLSPIEINADRTIALNLPISPVACSGLCSGGFSRMSRLFFALEPTFMQGHVRGPMPTGAAEIANRIHPRTTWTKQRPPWNSALGGYSKYSD